MASSGKVTGSPRRWVVPGGRRVGRGRSPRSRGSPGPMGAGHIAVHDAIEVLVARPT